MKKIFGKSFDILKDDWHSIRDGLEVKFVTMPSCDSDNLQTDAPESAAESQERFILCRSRERSKKEEGITQRFEKKIVDGLDEKAGKLPAFKRIRKDLPQLEAAMRGQPMAVESVRAIHSLCAGMVKEILGKDPEAKGGTP